MSKLPTVVTAAGLVLLLAVTAPSQMHAQGPNPSAPPAFDVKVVNTSQQPVPVTGTLTVSNLGSNPLPVRDVDRASAEPVQARVIQQPIGSTNPSGITVPSGKRLVIEYVSAEVLAADPDCVTAPRIALRTTVGGNAVVHYFYTENSGPVSALGGSARAYGLSQLTKVYADPDTQVTIDIRTSAEPVCSYLNPGADGLHISGYLVNVQ